MSKHHHDRGWYAYLMGERCIACPMRAEQLHHVSLIPSEKSSGLLPRRFSSYQVVPVCKQCHDKLHDGMEKAMGKDWFRDWIIPRLNRYAKSKGIVPPEGLRGAELMQWYHFESGLQSAA